MERAQVFEERCCSRELDIRRRRRVPKPCTAPQTCSGPTFVTASVSFIHEMGPNSSHTPKPSSLMTFLGAVTSSPSTVCGVISIIAPSSFTRGAQYRQSLVLLASSYNIGRHHLEMLVFSSLNMTKLQETQDFCAEPYDANLGLGLVNLLWLSDTIN